MSSDGVSSGGVSSGGGGTPLASRPHAEAAAFRPEDGFTSAAVKVVEELEGRLLEIRRELHQHPELSFQEQETTERLAAWLREAGLEPQTLPETTGLYVDIGPEDASFAAGFRGDIDALPLDEVTDLSYASRNPGVTHACGHDIHTTVMVGLALTLERLHRETGLERRYRVIFQPAEEMMPGGAKEVIRQGLLEPLPRLFALHCDPKLTVGCIGSRIGAITSASDLVRIEVGGRGGHTSRPQLTEDVVGALSHLAITVPTILARRIDVRSGVSLVWGHIQAGSAANAIPSTGTLTGTMRILDADAWKDAGGVLAPIVQQAAAPYGVEVNLEHIRGVPPVINSEEETGLVDAAAKDVLGQNCVTLAEQSMGGEDFAWMTQEVPGSMFRLGTRTPDGPFFDLHRGDYAPDERAIAVGVKVMAAVALRSRIGS